MGIFDRFCTNCVYWWQCIVYGIDLRALPSSTCTHVSHWPQYMDSWLARFCILVNACHRKPLGSHFTPVKTLDRHTDLCTCQCMKCNRWRVFTFKFHENSGKKMEKFPRSSRLLSIYWKLLKKFLMLINLKFVQY